MLATKRFFLNYKRNEWISLLALWIRVNEKLSLLKAGKTLKSHDTKDYVLWTRNFDILVPQYTILKAAFNTALRKASVAILLRATYDLEYLMPRSVITMPVTTTWIQAGTK